MVSRNKGIVLRLVVAVVLTLFVFLDFLQSYHHPTFKVSKIKSTDNITSAEVTQNLMALVTESNTASTATAADIAAYWSENRKNRLVPEVSCPDIIQGNQSAIQDAVTYMRAHPRRLLYPDSIFLKLTQNCTEFKEIRGYVQEPLTPEAAEFPLAFNILYYKDLVQVERLLRSIYRPNNVYCLHMDAYSSDILLKASKALVGCFNNVFLASKPKKVVYMGFSRLQAEINCMKDALKFSSSWKYYINLPSQVFPLKTNEELVQILKLYQGSNLVDNYEKDIHPKRFQFKVLYKMGHDSRRHAYRGKAGKSPLNPPPPHNITLLKSSSYGVFSRRFLEYVTTDRVPRDFLKWVADTLMPEEFYWASLNALRVNPHLPSPGGNLANPFRTEDVVTYVQWNWQSTKICNSGRKINGICILGLKDLNTMISSGRLFANKFHLDLEYLGMDCLEEYLWKKNQNTLEQDKKYLHQHRKRAKLQLRGDS